MNDDRGVPGRPTGGRPLRPPLRVTPQEHSGTVSRSAIRPRRGGTAAGSWLLFVGAAVAATVAVAWVFGATGDGTTGDPVGTPRAALAETARPSPEPTPRATATPTTPTFGPTPTESPVESPSFVESPTEALPVRLVIDAPVDGQVVEEPFVVVVGRAPADAPITRDIRLWFDEHTVASPGGSWTMRVGLAPGDNELRFRIGDDATTARTIHVIYEPRI